MEEEGHSDLISFQPTDSDLPSFLEDCNRVLLCPWSLGVGNGAGPSVHEFFKQEYWRGLPFTTLGGLPDPRIKSMSFETPVLADSFFTVAPPRKPYDGGLSHTVYSDSPAIKHLLHIAPAQLPFVICLAPYCLTP